MDIKYNPKILQKEVNRLYYRARGIILGSIIISLIIDGLIAFLIKNFHLFDKQARQNHYLSISIYISVILFGLFIGLEKSFRLRLEAQKILCIMSIKNDTELILNSLADTDEDADTDKDEKNGSLGYNQDDEFVLESGIKEINDKIDKI